MTGIEVVVGYLIAWAVQKARRVGRRADTEVDAVLDAGMDRLHEVVATKLGGDPALTKLESEAAAGEPGERTKERVRLAVEDAAETDPAFANELSELVAKLRAAEAGAGVAATGDHATAVRDVDIHA